MFHDWLTVLPNGVSSMLTVERIAGFVDRHLDGELSERDRAPIRLEARTRERDEGRATPR
jgi:hypothetical protein